jgi:hypothetical protein
MKKDHQFLCRNCEREITAPLAAAGHKTRCCLCEAVIVVPTAEEDRQFRDEVQRREEEEERKKREENAAAQERASIIAHDITERERAEADRKRAEQKNDAERKLIHSGESVHSSLDICAAICWLGTVGNVAAAIYAGSNASPLAAVPFVTLAAVSALAVILISAFGGWFENYSWVIARISHAVRREDGKADEN